MLLNVRLLRLDDAATFLVTIIYPKHIRLWTEKKFNERIAMSLLRQCAWMWEHCYEGPAPGEYKLNEVIKMKRSAMLFTGCDKSAFMAEHFDGVKEVAPDSRPWVYAVVQLAFKKEDGNGFMCSYPIESVFSTVTGFYGVGSLTNKVRFCCDESGRRWTVLPEVKSKAKSKPKSKPRATVKAVKAATPVGRTDGHTTTAELSFAEQVRLKLLEIMGQRMAA